MSRRVRAGVVGWVLFAIAVSGWAAFLRPATLGGSTAYVIVSGSSMEPMMHTGDLAVVREQRSYAPGDVVAYRIPADDVGAGMLVIHRVIGEDGDGRFVLRGDNREHPDSWRPDHNDVLGALQWHVPHVGTGLFLLRSPLVLAAVLGFLGFWHVAMRDEAATPPPSAPTPTPHTPMPPAAPQASTTQVAMGAASPPARRPAVTGAVATLSLVWVVAALAARHMKP